MNIHVYLFAYYIEVFPKVKFVIDNHIEEFFGFTVIDCDILHLKLGKGNKMSFVRIQQKEVVKKL